MSNVLAGADSSETIKFYWKISGETNSDYLKFYIDDTYKGQITGEQDWDDAEFTVPAGIHTLKWIYCEGGSYGDNAWVDYVQWTGPSPQQDPSNWQAIDYKHDVYGRRSEKKVDGYSTRYLYDGPHVIAEYDGNNNLLRKYIYGPGIDQPVCMIEVAESNAAYYYHFDGLGSVVALSDSSGDTVQTYQYSVYGQVAVEDINHPNPYMFAGVRFDIEIGLYYNRARYYNPFTGRFLQTDPAGDGMNLYAYCGNNSINRVDPTGLYWTFLDSWYVEDYLKNPKWVGKLVFAWVDDADANNVCPNPENVDVLWTGMSFSGKGGWYNWAKTYFPTNTYKKWVKEETVGYDLSRTWVGDTSEQDVFFWRLQAMRFLSSEVDDTISDIEGFMRTTNRTVVVRENTTPRAEYGGGPNGYNTKWKPNTVLIEWNPSWTWTNARNMDDIVPGFVSLSHELAHALDYMKDGQMLPPPAEQDVAIALENHMRLAFYWKVPGWSTINWRRP